MAKGRVTLNYPLRTNQVIGMWVEATLSLPILTLTPAPQTHPAGMSPGSLLSASGDGVRSIGSQGPRAHQLFCEHWALVRQAKP